MSRKKVAHLEILGQTYHVYDGMNIVGRDLEASIIIRNLKISKKHAIISVIGDKQYITDFNSSNGCTIKNETLVPYKFYEIQDKSRIILGDLDATYYIGSSPSTESQDGPFLKPSIPKHIRFAPTTQVIEAKVSASQDDTYLAATQLMTDENPQQSSLNDSKATVQNKIFSLLSTSHDKTNDSKEIVFCDESLEENFNYPFTREKIDDSSIIPATQDVSFENIPKGSSNLNQVQDDSQDATQIENYDSDATDIEDDDKCPQIHISINNSSPVPPPENIVNDSKNILSDDEEIDFYENNEFNPNITSTELEADVTNLENSNFQNKTSETENHNVLIADSIPETEEYNFIPETQHLDIVQNNQVQPNEHKKISVSSEKVPNPTNNLNSSTKLNTLPTINTQQEQNSIREEDDVYFIGATQDIISSNSNVAPKSDQVKSAQNIPKLQFNPPAASKFSNENILEINQVENDKFDAQTELLKLAENSEFVQRSSTPKIKSQESNKFLNDEDDMYFVGSTQDILKNSRGLDTYYSDENNDGIPEMPSSDVEIYPVGIEENRNGENKGKDGVTEKEANLTKSPIKSSEINQNPPKSPKRPDFSAPTQLLDANNPILAPKDAYLLAKSTKNQKSTKDNLNMNSLQNRVQKINVPIDFDAETQIVIHPEPPEEQSPEQKVRKVPDFSAPTLKLLASEINESEMFVAPTQELLDSVTPKGKNNPLKSAGMNSSKEDAILMAPAQEILEGSFAKAENMNQNRKGSTDSEGSDIILNKKRKPKRILETQEEEAHSDSDPEIGYVKKKCLPIFESQQTQETNEGHQINRNRTNDSAVISDLEDTQESMRLVFSNTSINISSQSQSNLNKSGETQLEILLPTQNKFLLMQNSRPSNPLAQILDVKTQTQNLNEVKNVEETGPNKYRTKKFVYDMEATQIFEEDLDESLAEIPDSDPEDYTDFCEMETQPIGEISPIPKTPNKQDPKVSTTEIGKVNQRGRRSKKEEIIFLQPTSTVPRNKKEEATTSRITRRSTPKKEETTPIVKENDTIVILNKINFHDTQGTSSTSREINRTSIEEVVAEAKPTRRTNLKKKQNVPNKEEKETSEPIINPLEEEGSSLNLNANKRDKISKEELVLEAKATRRTNLKTAQNIINEEGNEDPRPKTARWKPSFKKGENILEVEKEVSKPKEDSTETNALSRVSSSGFLEKRENLNTRSTRSSNPKGNETNDEGQNTSRSKRKSNETNALGKDAVSSAKTSKVLESQAKKNKTAPKKEDMGSNIDQKEKPTAKESSTEMKLLGNENLSINVATQLEVVDDEQSNPLVKLVSIRRRGKPLKVDQNQEGEPVIEVKQKRGRMSKKKDVSGKEIQENIEVGMTRTFSKENLANFVELQCLVESKHEEPSSSKRNAKSASTTGRSKPGKSTARKQKGIVEELNTKEKDTLQVEKSTSRRTIRGTSELKKMEPSSTRGKSTIKKEPVTSTRSKRAATLAPEPTKLLEVTSTSKRAASVVKEVENQTEEVTDSRKGKKVLDPPSSKRSTRGQSISKEEPSTSKNSRASSLAKEEPPIKGTTSKKKTCNKTAEDKSNEEFGQEKETNKEQREQNKNKSTGTQNTKKKTKLDPVSDENETPTKRTKTRQNTEDLDIANQSSKRDVRTKHKIVFTMLDDTNLEATVDRLGGKTVDSSQECTILVTSKISRSLKFLVAVSMGKPIVGPDWVHASGHANKFLDPWNYILKDSETEKQLNFKLRKAIENGTRTKMFDGYVFLILVNKNYDVIKNVIEACGGEVVTKVPKNNTKIFMIVSYPEDKSKYNRYLKQKPPITVVGAEAIFAGALLQKLILDQHFLQ